MNSFLGVIGAVFVGVIVYVITKMILDSIIEQIRLTKEIEFNLNYYANVYSLSKREDVIYVQAAELFRKLGASLLSTVSGIPCIFYCIFEKLGFLVSKYNIKEASKALLSLSNGNLLLRDKDEIGHIQRETIKDNIEISKKIGSLLNINLWFWPYSL